jgi:phosphoglucosamine mutase
MKRYLVGTGGMRDTVNVEPMTAETAMRLGMMAGSRFKRDNYHPSAVIGRDTRLSGYTLQPASSAGFTSVGMDAVLLCPLPTPTVANSTRGLRADLGVMISASHNPFEDKGIKLFGPDGFKLSDEVETELEEMMASGGSEYLVPLANTGRASRLDDVAGRL